ncbi:DUF434 domain-containing protein [Clostridium sp. Marseille-P2415]|uniref:DUF434 domain-containing protein n=1 Tax=Clostridium sp. Marseille-P2415 TaxID=1805471 RepID=UPI001F3B7EF8
MNNQGKRGSSPKDEREFGNSSMQTLYKAGRDIYYLINHGYKIKNAVTFVGNHYLLSERQRIALARAITSNEELQRRKEKEVKNNLEEKTVYIDGFNTIITLEVALSGSLILKCMDETFRDLAGLRGSYRIISETKEAIALIGEALQTEKISKAVFFLDTPVSNSGKLKEQIAEQLSSFSFAVEIHNIFEVDRTLEQLENVITSDAIILDRCKSWINLNQKIIEAGTFSYLDFSIENLEEE